MAPSSAEPSRRVDRRLARETAAARRQFATAGVLGIGTAGLVVAQAALLAEIIARAAVEHAGLAQLRSPLIALSCVIAARALLAGGFELSGRRGALGVMSELRQRLAKRVLIEHAGRLPEERTGELAAAAVQGVDALESYFAGYLPAFVLATAVPLAVLIWVTPLDLSAAIVLAITIPILIVFMVLIGKGAEARTRSRWRVLSLLSSHFLDVVRGLETLRAFRREQAQILTLTEVGDRYRHETLGTLRLAFTSALVLELCAMLGTALVAATIGVQLTGGHLTLRAGLTVLLLAPELYAPLRAVGQQFHASADGLAAAERLLESLDARPPVQRGESLIAAGDPATGPLRFEGVSYSYPSRRGEVLAGVELSIQPGETVALVGASGAGKSTIAALVLRLVDPSSGRVSCGGVDLRDLSLEAWHRRVAWVPQRPKLFAGTIRENIALADPDAASEQIARAAEKAGLGSLLSTLPDGLDTIVGDGGRRLSAGQSQRIALARAFLRDAPLVVLDEPTANLDPASAASIGDVIARLTHGRMAVMIVHDSKLAARADRVVEVGSGHARERAFPCTPLPALSQRPAAQVLERPAANLCAPPITPSAACDRPATEPVESLWSSLARAAGLTPGERRRLWLSVALGFGAVAAAAGLLTTSGYLISRAAQRPDILSLTAVIVGVRAFGIARATLRYGERLASHDLALRVLARLRTRFFAVLAPLVPGSIRGHTRGELLSRFVGDVDALQDLYVRALAPPLVAVLVIVGAGVSAGLMLPVAAIAVGGSLLVAATLVPAITAMLAAKAGRRQAGARAHLMTEFVEAIDGGAELSVAGRGPERLSRLAAANQRLVALGRRDALAASAATVLGSLLGGLAVIAVLVVAVPAVHDGALAGVLLAALVFLVLGAFEGVAPLPAAARRLRACAEAARRLEELSSLEPAVSDPARPRPAPAGSDVALSIDRVRFRYEDDEPWLLDGVSLTLEPGCRVLLAGSNGAGKTTLAQLLVRFVDPGEGTVRLGGLDLRELTQDDVRRAVLLAAQDAHVFTTTIRENLLLARREATEAELWSALETVDLADWVRSLPDGLDTLVGEDGELVSGGQRQRIALARSLISDARFLILDEPTAHLDRDTATTVMRAIDRAAGERGVFVISHREEGLEGFTTRLKLRDGHLYGEHRARLTRHLEVLPSLDHDHSLADHAIAVPGLV